MNSSVTLFTSERIHCIFCGQEVIPDLNDENGVLDPCAHTQIISHSEGIEYISEGLEKLLAEMGFNTDEGFLSRDDDEDFDQWEVLEDLEIPNSLLVTRGSGTPGDIEVNVYFALADS